MRLYLFSILFLFFQANEKCLVSASQGKFEYFQAGYDKFINGDYKKAFEYLSMAIENHENLEKAYTIRGDARRFMDDFKGALSDYIKAHKINQMNHELLIKKAIAYSLLRDYKNSLLNYDKAIQLMPENATAYCGRGYVKILKKEYSDALKDFKKAIEIDPLSVQAILGRGICEDYLGDYKSAYRDFSKAVELDPSENRLDSISKYFSPEMGN
ncbi:MAG: tetratricopeptide repeat protein [Bacteroidota bacterium]|nr:tetratricopeptide repeat protein [Bacteroidota bacterium]MDP4191601.1 tetratricopeptide repeat protein [Bacteroidota bacterium]MDP4196843.1 tetratricopeptide repeat protein [Bacteroidota bacterium]